MKPCKLIIKAANCATATIDIGNLKQILSKLVGIQNNGAGTFVNFKKNTDVHTTYLASGPRQVINDSISLFVKAYFCILDFVL